MNTIRGRSRKSTMTRPFAACTDEEINKVRYDPQAIESHLKSVAYLDVDLYSATPLQGGVRLLQWGRVADDPASASGTRLSTHPN